MSSIPNNYEINVAKKKNPEDQYGTHFCRIQIDNAWNDEMADEQLRFFRELFGDSYHVSMTHWECCGKVKEGWE